MLPPIDPNTKRFYLEMGFSQSQIARAYEQTLRFGGDMLDTLNHSSAPSATKPPSSANKPSSSHPPPAPSKGSYSFLTPWNKVRASEYEVLFSRSSKHMQFNSKVEVREAEYPVGLLNLSNCCYLNSLLQCYFLMNDFKVAILTAEPIAAIEQVLAGESKTKIKRIKSEYELLAKLRWFFTKMALTSRRHLDPTPVLHNLVDSVGEKVSYGEEKDLSEINILIIQRLSQGLTYSKNHYKHPHQQQLLDMDFSANSKGMNENEARQQPYNSLFSPQQGAIKKLFYGTRVEYYVEGAQQKEAPILSDFTGLILNPRAGSLYKSLDEEFNFEVELNGGLHKKVAFIRDEPEYLFLYINRTEFDREQGHTMKNQQNFSFDFMIYLDRYLEKYREEGSVVNERIQELLTIKNKIKEQINNLHLLLKKIEECYKYVQELEGWAEKLPSEQQFQEEFDSLQEKLSQVQKQLDQIESRRQQYHLMYIFVHRGDAVSGHYWGYGRNDSSWYRFDINTKKMLQQQIIIDMEKSSATPYALLYVKQSNLPRFSYPIHLATAPLKHYPPSDFRGCLDPASAGEVVAENVQLQQEMVARNNKVIRNKASAEYINRYNGVKKVGKRYNEERAGNRYVGQLDIINNFSLFLWSREEYDLCKFTLFEQAVLSASGYRTTIDKLIHDGELLPKIQKKFKRICKGQLYLKSYALMPKEVDRLTLLHQEYQLTAFELIWACVVLHSADLFLEEWHAETVRHNGAAFPLQPSIKTRILFLLKLLKIRYSLMRSQEFKQAAQSLPYPLFISQINNELTKLILFRIATTGVKLASLHSFMSLDDPLGSQIATINAGNSYDLDQKLLVDKAHGIQSAFQLISKFHDSYGSKTSQRTSASTNSASKQGQTPLKSGTARKSSAGLQTDGSLSPSKSNALTKQSSSKQRKPERGLIVCLKQILVLQGKQCWKIEQLQNIKINYGFQTRLMSFLKQLGVLPRIYKHILETGKTLSVSELRDAGLDVNRQKQPEAPLPPEEPESLI